MPFSTVYLIPIAVSLVLAYQYVIIPAFISPLAKIPAANWLAKISGIWIVYIRWKDIENQTVLALHRKLGPIVRLGPNELSVNSYEDGVKTIYQGGFTKHEFYANRFLWYNTRQMFTMSDNRQHSERKRLISHIYSKSNIYTDATIRATASKIVHERLIPIISDSATSQEPIDVLRLCWSYSMDRFTAFQFGLQHASNFLQNRKEREWYMKSFFSGKPYTFWTDHFPILIDILARIGLNVLPPSLIEGLAEMEDWNLQKCDAAEGILSKGGPTSIEDRPALYAHIRTAINKSCPQPSNPTPQKYPYRLDLASEMFDHSAAAIETSGNTLTWLLYEMSRHPNLQTSLREELLTLDNPLLTDNPSSPLPNFKALDNLPLLSTLMQETLRHWIVLPGGQPRLTPYPSCSLAGHTNIPPNVKVHSAAGVLHRNPDVFPHPFEWLPERWMNRTEAELREMGHWMWAFSSGGRMCIGSNFAMNSMKLLVAAIYTNFTTTIVDAEGIEMCEGFISGPKGEKLVLQFHRVEQ